MPYDNVLYDTADNVATVTLNRPTKLNTLGHGILGDVRDAFEEANRDDDVKVIVLRGAGRAFCAGFDFSQTAAPGRPGGSNDAWDPGSQAAGGGTLTGLPMNGLLTPWKSPKPVIGQVHGWCIGGGSDLVLTCDIVIAAEDAQIGIPYARVWGCNLTGMLIYRLGLTRAKGMMLTGEPVDGRTAEEIGLINRAGPGPQLEDEVQSWAQKLAQIPHTQLAVMKLIINQAYDNMGLNTTQILGPILDSLMRHTPEGLAFVHTAFSESVHAAVTDRDGPFGDYSQAPPDRQPRWHPDLAGTATADS